MSCLEFGVYDYQGNCLFVGSHDECTVYQFELYEIQGIDSYLKIYDDCEV